MVKFSKDFLKTGKSIEPLEKIADKPAEPQGKVYDVKYDETKGILTTPAIPGTAHEAAITHAGKYGFKVVNNLKEALIGRTNGEAVLSPREADTLARSDTKPILDFLQMALKDFGAFIVEGEPLMPANTWELRQRYNRGITWRNNERKRATVIQQEKGDARLIEIKQELANYRVPLYPHEEQNGIDRELCKPEYLTWEQFQTIQQRVKQGSLEYHKDNLGYGTTEHASSEN